MTKTQATLFGNGLLLLAAALAVGCGPKGPKLNAAVEGTVTVDGELAPRGTVTFTPAKGGPAAVGRIFANGSYTIRVGQGDLTNPDGGKLPAGDYVVSVIVTGEAGADEVVAKGGPPLAGPRLSAQKYMSEKTSDLKYTIKPGKNVINLELVGTSADPPPPEESEDEAAEGEQKPSEEGAAEGEAPPATIDGPTEAAPAEDAGELEAKPETPAATTPETQPAEPPAAAGEPTTPVQESAPPAAESEATGGETK